MKQLLILSGKGGTGKTTVASAMIQLSNAKAFADCDVDAPNLHLLFEQKSSVIKRDYFGLPKAKIDPSLCINCNLCLEHCRFDAIFVDGDYKVDASACEGCKVCELVCPVHAITMIDDIAGELKLFKHKTVFSTAKLKVGSGTSGLLVTEVKKQMKEASDAKFAIIDGSPGIGCPVIASLNGIDMVLIVSEPSVSGISDMERIIKTAQNFKTKIAVCINKYDINLENTLVIEKYCEINKIDFLGKIPFDEAAIKAINNGHSIVDVNCKAGQAVIDIYEKILPIFSRI